MCGLSSLIIKYSFFRLVNFGIFQVIPIGDPIPAVSADYSEGEDRLFNLFGGGGRPKKPSFNLFGGNKGNKGGGRPSYKAPGSSRPKPSYGAPKPSYSAPKPSYGAPAVNNARLLHLCIYKNVKNVVKPFFRPPSNSYGVPQAPPVGYGVPQVRLSLHRSANFYHNSRLQQSAATTRHPPPVPL